jgi:hypothetical protein
MESKLIYKGIEIPLNWLNAFKERASLHIALVKKYYRRYTNRRLLEHDSDKFSNNLIMPYTLVNAGYNLGYKFTDYSKALTNKATFKHIKSNKHHPEYWDDNIKNQDTENVVNASRMPINALIEMCADWCAMSEELGDNPFSWFKKVNNVKFVFTERQQKSIVYILNKMWN